VLDVSLSLGIIKSATDKSLCGVKSVLGVLNGLALGNITSMARAVFGEGNYRGGGTDT